MSSLIVFLRLRTQPAHASICLVLPRAGGSGVEVWTEDSKNENEVMSEGAGSLVWAARIDQSALGSLWGKDTGSTLVKMLTLMLKKEKFTCED